MTSAPVEEPSILAQPSFGAKAERRFSPMSGKTFPAGRWLPKSDQSTIGGEQASAGQTEPSRRVCSLLEASELNPEEWSQGNAEPASNANTSNDGRPNDFHTWRALRNELAAAESAEAGADAYVAPSGTLLKSTSMALPSRPKPPSSASVETTDRKLAEYYHGMHPPPNAQVITSPPEQPCLADYSPWTGDDAENQLSEQIIKSGYALKQPVVGETESAKKAFTPCFKHYAGIQSLSLILASVLHQRHENGKVTAASTFKPPPRVTLTDTKREVWLNDLANPLIPLRRLSRTIPHGVRGKVLLEHSVIKMVPIPRAVWLAQCVGANELRAFRRKGITSATMLENEQKWVREWTTVVEAFLVDCSSSHHLDWKSRFSYALRLTSQLFVEQLLDREHFLDWCLHRFDTSNDDLLPLAMLTIYMTLSSLMSSLQHRRRLATICLTKIQNLLKSPDVDLLLPLLDRLKFLTRKLAIQSPQSLILHRSWHQHRDIFVSLIQESEQACASIVEELDRNALLDEILALRTVIDHNDNIACATGNNVPSKANAELSLISQLDNLDPHTQVDQVAQHLLQIIPEISHIVAVIVEWSISLYREGLHHIYLIARLLRQYRSLGHDTDGYILNSWGRFNKRTIACPRRLSRLIAELTRTGDFNATLFLRWLIARGGINESDTPFGLQVLVDLPVSSQQPGVAGLQRMLLQNRKLFSHDQSMSASVKQSLQDQVRKAVNSGYDGKPVLQAKVDGTSLNCSDIFEISELVRESLSLQLKERKEDAVSSAVADLPCQAMKLTTASLRRITNILELISDYVALVEVFSMILNECEPDTLVLVANTLEANFECTSCIGATEQLCQKLCDRYRILRKTHPPLREPAMSIISLCSRLSSFESFIPRLKEEVAYCDSAVGVAAHTPMSDVHVESNSNGDGDPEAGFTISANADIQQITAVFEAMTLKVAQQIQDEHALKQLMNSLLSLKAHHESMCQDVVVNWVRDQFVLASIQNSHRDVIIFLLRSGCLDVADFINLVDDCCNALSSEEHVTAVTVSIRTLNLVLSPGTDATAMPLTRASVKLERFTRDHPDALIPFIRRCLGAPNGSDIATQAQHVLQSEPLLSMLRTLIVHDPSNVSSLFKTVDNGPAFSEQNELIRKLMNHLMDPSSALHLTEATNAEVIALMFETVNGFSLSAFHLLLRYVTSEAFSSDESRATLATACFEAVVAAQSSGCELWRLLVTSVDEKIARQICTLAEDQLGTNPTEISEHVAEQTAGGGLDARRWSEIVEATAFSLPSEGTAQTGRSIQTQLARAASLMSGNTELQSLSNQQWLQAVCHLTMIRSKCCTAAGNSTSVVQVLCGLLARDVGHWTAQTLRSIFDVTAVMIEELSLQNFAHVKNNVGQFTRHQSICFLFGIAEDRDGWLYATLVTPSQGGSAALSSQEQNAQHPFPLKRWELLPDLSQNPGANDTALSMKLFDASKDA